MTAEQPGPPALDDLSVLVMGMHRSGTSAVAGALQAAGISAGPAEALMGARPDNPRSFGELQAVVDLDDRLLEALDWSWDAPAASPVMRPPAFDDLVNEGRSLTEPSRRGSTRLLKDPRMSLLLPWWRRILLDRFVVVLPIRSPAEVAWSLAVRNGFPFELGLALWCTYHRHLAAGLDGLPVVVVSYQTLVDEPAAVMGPMLQELTRLGIRGPLDAEAAAGTVVPTLRRATQPAAAESSVVMIEANGAAAAWAMGPVAAFDRFRLEVAPPAGWESALLGLRRQTIRAERLMATAWRETAQARHEARLSRADAAAATVLADELRTRRPSVATQGAHQKVVGAVRRQNDVRRLVRRGVTRLPAPIGDHVYRNPLFDAEWYLDQHPELRSTGADAYRDYRRVGISSGRDPNPWFDTLWYLEHNPDVRPSGMDPLDHYLYYGAAEGRDPSPRFSTRWYLEQNADVRGSGANPLVHYLRYGHAEGRLPRPEDG